MRRKTFSSLLTLSLAMLAVLTTNSCANTDDGSYVDPIAQYERIGGKWVLNTVTQTDETTTSTMDLTNVFNFDSFGIALNVDANNQPTTFAVTGNAPALLPTQGTWKLGNPYVNSDGSAAQIILNDKVYLTVTAVPGANPTLEYKVTRKNNGVAFVSYTYNLSAQQ